MTKTRGSSYDFCLNISYLSAIWAHNLTDAIVRKSQHGLLVTETAVFLGTIKAGVANAQFAEDTAAGPTLAKPGVLINPVAGGDHAKTKAVFYISASFYG